MKVAAHPLVVAVALGLVAPDALEASVSEDDRPGCADCADAASEDVMEPWRGSTDTSVAGTEVWAPGQAPSEAERDRVERAWQQLTTLNVVS